MANDRNIYSSPLVERNASKEMAELFGQQKKFGTWRRIWLELAKAERKLGLKITAVQLKQMEEHLDDINFDKAAEFEKKLRHDVMAHIHTFALKAPKAAPIIHLGATSCDITDNADLIIMRDAMRIIAGKIAAVVNLLGNVSKKYRAMPTLGFTHYQAAQLTTVGKRATLWCNEFVMDLQQLEFAIDNLPFRGIKGTTGTQASFLSLFDGNHNKVKQLDKGVAKAFGFKNTCAVTGQTYQRKIDSIAINCLALVAQSAHKMCNDLRLLANLKEVEEPFEKSQVGSSAMAYKRNPMRAERVTALSRLVLSLASSPAMTASEQWLERTLDDSANRRIVIPEAFLAVDGILEILANVLDGLVVYPKVIAAHVEAELPFMATENILMAGVKAGGSRQELHEKIRLHSQAAAKQVKEFGKENDLIERLKTDSAFSKVNFKTVLNPKDYIGRASQQVDEFVRDIVAQFAGNIATNWEEKWNLTCKEAGNVTREELIKRVKESSYLEGDFILRSGKHSKYYLDKYLFETCPDILAALGKEFAKHMTDDVTLVAGAELGGVALAASTAMATGKNWIIVRNSKKGYGTGKMVEGVLKKDDVVLLVEDIATTGGQVLEAAKIIADVGAKVKKIVCVIDRKQGAGENLTAAGYKFESILTKDDLGIKD